MLSVHRVPLALQGLRGRKVPPGPWGRKVLRGPLELRVSRALQVLRVQLDRRVLLVLRDRRGLKVVLELPAPLDQSDLRGFRGPPELRVSRALLVPPALKVLQVLRALLVPLALRGFRDLLESLDRKVPLVLLVPRESKGHRVSLDLRDLLVRPAHKAYRGRLA